MPDQKLKFLDGLRGLAAIYVVIGHARWLLWEGYSEGFVHHPDLYSAPAKLLMYFLSTSRYGHSAVMLFFVLSGFVIHLRYSRQLSVDPVSATFDWSDFVKRRIRRLYPPLIFAILLTLVLDLLGKALLFPIYQQATQYSLINANITSQHDLRKVIETLALLPNTGNWGSNVPLWSLKYEWWFYMLYPLCWVFSRASIRTATLVMIGMFVLSFIPVPPPFRLLSTLFSAMIIWWFGALLADIYTGRLQVNLRYVALFVLLLPLAVVVNELISEPATYVQSVLIDVLWGAGFAGLIAACLIWYGRGGSLRLLEIFKPLGDFSYTLYVTHFPILVFMSGYLFTQAPTLPQYFEWFFVGVGICTVFAYFVHFLVEKPFLANSRLATRQTKT